MQVPNLRIIYVRISYTKITITQIPSTHLLATWTLWVNPLIRTLNLGRYAVVANQPRTVGMQLISAPRVSKKSGWKPTKAYNHNPKPQALNFQCKALMEPLLAPFHKDSCLSRASLGLYVLSGEHRTLNTWADLRKVEIVFPDLISIASDLGLLGVGVRLWAWAMFPKIRL